MYDLLSVASFATGIFALVTAVRKLATSDYVAAALAIAAGFLMIVASTELFRYALSIWITETRREK